MKRRGLHTYLVALVLAALLPGILAAGLAVWWASSAFRDTSLSRLTDIARTLARAVESSLEIDATMLATLDSLPASSTNTADSLRPWLDEVGSRLGGRVAIATLASDGALTGLSGIDVPEDIVRQAIATQRPAVSNLYTVPGQAMPLIAIAVPRTGRATGSSEALVYVTPPTVLIRILQQHGEALSGILVAVTDGTGHLVARSRDPERYVGKLVPDWAKLKAVGADRGTFDALTTEGFPIVFTFQTLRGTPGWVVVVGEPLKVFDDQWQRPLFGLAIGGLIAIILALIVAGWIARLILRPVRALAQHGRTVAADDTAAPPMQVPPSSIGEFEILRQSFEDAELALRRRAEAEKHIADELASSERRYRAVAEAGALVFWRRDASGAVRSATGWYELTGQAEEAALGDGWAAYVHPDDQPQVAIAWDEARAQRSVIDVEFRVRAVNGQWRWVRARGALAGDPNGVALEWVGALEDVDARRQAQARIVYMAHHDALTGLANRILLRESLDEALDRASQGSGGALLCVDLDRFKGVNDTLGHPVGDALLRAVTERLRACAGPGDLIARLGGDEFSIIQADANQPSAASALANRLITELAAPYELNGQHIIIGASVGVALIADRTNRDQLLKNADLALYRAKEDGRGRFRFFEPEMDARMQERHRLEKDLRRGVAAGEFEIHYQPLVNLRTRALTGFEALLRWNHPQRGLLQPGDFIPAMEDTGLIVPLGERVLMQACAEAATWPEHLRVAVNISSGQLASPGLVDAVNAALHASQLMPGRLQLEITENALIENIETGLASLLRMKLTGVSIAMDNFGTGYSSLGYLQAFPFDKVKIDRSFVRDLGEKKEGRAIIRAVTGLCDSLGIVTTAEGVETEAQLAFLLGEECTEAQGYLFGHPCLAKDIPALLSRLAIVTNDGTGGYDVKLQSQM